MAPKLFIIGGTGYIGGDALVQIIDAHPDWAASMTCLARNSEKGATIAAVFPQVKIVYGDLDSVELIEEEASKADIVYDFADCDHTASAEAISRGLARQTKKCFWIHTSGTMILGWQSVKEGSWGETQSKVYDDWEGVGDLVSLPDGAAHRHVDKIVLAASQANPDKIKTAICCPPTIWGEGRGPGNRRSVQVYKSAEAFLKTQQAFMVGRGNNVWYQVHVADLSKLYLLLGEAAVSGGSPATWNDEGYYLAENGSFVWGEVLKAVAKEAHKQGFLPSEEVKQLSIEEAQKVLPGVSRSIAADSQGKAIRGRKLLGWTPQERSLMEEIPDIVVAEAKAAGVLKGHAEKVSG